MKHEEHNLNQTAQSLHFTNAINRSHSKASPGRLEFSIAFVFGALISQQEYQTQIS